MSKKDFIGVAPNPGGALKTPATAAAFFPPVSTEGMAISREDLEYDETLGSRAPSAREYGGRLYEGDIEGAARPNSFPPFLSMFLGSPTSTDQIGAAIARTTPYVLGELHPSGARLYEATTAGTTAGAAPGSLGTTTAGQTVTDGTAVWTDVGPSAGAAVYKHVWDPTAAGKRPMPATLWTVNDDVVPAIVDKFVGAVGNELSLEVEANGYLVFTAGLLAAVLDQTASAPSATRDTTKKWAFHQLSAQISVAGAALEPIKLTAFSMSYNNNLVDDLFVLGSTEVEDLPPGNIESEVGMTSASDIPDHYRRALKDTPEDVRLVLKASGARILAAGTHAYSIEIDLKRLQYTEAPVEIDASETLRGVEITAVPVFDETTSGLVTVTVENNQTGAAYVG